MNEVLQQSLDEAQKNLDANNLEKAKEFFEVALEIERKNEKALAGLLEIRRRTIQKNLTDAERFLLNNDFSASQKAYRRVLELAPDNQTAKDGLNKVREKENQKFAQEGFAFLKKGDYKNARSRFEEALKTDHNHLESLKGLQDATYSENMEFGHQAFKDKDYRQASEYFRRAREAKPEPEAEGWESIANGYLTLEEANYSKAREYFEKALEITPDKAEAKAGRYDAYFQAAQQAEKAGRHNEAIGMYSIIANENPQAAERMKLLKRRKAQKTAGILAAITIIVLTILAATWLVSRAYVKVPDSLCTVAQCTPTPTSTPTATFTPTPTPVPMTGIITVMDVPYYAKVTDVRTTQAYIGTLSQGQNVYICAGYSDDRYLIALDLCHKTKAPLGWIEKKFLSKASFINLPDNMVTPGARLPTPTATPTATPTSTPTSTPTPTQFPVEVRFQTAGYFKDTGLSVYLGSFGKEAALYICAGYSLDRFLVSDRPCHENGTKGWVNKRFLEEAGIAGFGFANFPAAQITPGPTLPPPTATPTPGG